MMERGIGILSGVLAAQLVLSAFLLWPGERQDTGSTPLLSPETTGAVTAIEVRDSEGQTVALRRTDGRWIIDAEPILPADAGKVSALLDALRSDPGFSVAQTEGARQRFAVGEGEFERRLAIGLDDGASRTIYLGTSPGFRQIHARAADRPAIVRIDFNAYDAPGDRSGWLDRTLLQPEGLERIEAGDVLLLKNDTGAWVDSTGATWPEEDAQQLVTVLEDLRVTGIGEALQAPEPEELQQVPAAPEDDEAVDGEAPAARPAAGAASERESAATVDPAAGDDTVSDGEVAAATGRGAADEEDTTGSGNPGPDDEETGATTLKIRSLALVDAEGGYTLRLSALDTRHTVESDRFPGVVFNLSAYDHDRVTEAMDALAEPSEQEATAESAVIGATP